TSRPARLNWLTRTDAATYTSTTSAAKSTASTADAPGAAAPTLTIAATASSSSVMAAPPAASATTVRPDRRPTGRGYRANTGAMTGSSWVTSAVTNALASSTERTLASLPTASRSCNRADSGSCAVSLAYRPGNST